MQCGGHSGSTFFATITADGVASHELAPRGIHGQHVLAVINAFPAACVFRSTRMGGPPEKAAQICYIDHRNIFPLPLQLDDVEDLPRRFFSPWP